MTLGDDAVIHARSGIIGSVPEKAAMMGIPAVPLRQFMDREVKMRRLPNLIKDLQRQVASLAGETQLSSAAQMSVRTYLETLIVFLRLICFRPPNRPNSSSI